jgi:hypothetical protein
MTDRFVQLTAEEILDMVEGVWNIMPEDEKDGIYFKRRSEAREEIEGLLLNFVEAWNTPLEG